MRAAPARRSGGDPRPVPFTSGHSKRTVIVLTFAALISGCGFQLRGADVLPPDLSDLYISAPIQILSEVEFFLEGSDTRLVDARSDASVVLTIANERYDRRLLSVDPSTGKEREFELSYAVDVNAASKDGTSLLAQQTVVLVRDFVFDRDALLGASREETVLREEMRRDAVIQIMNRLRAATRR